MDTTNGREHMAWFPSGRRNGQANYADVVRRADAGEDVTELVLAKLLPHLDSPYNRERGAWTCIAPVVTRDIRQWFEGAGWARPADWPNISLHLLSFFRNVIEDPEKLPEECDAFRDSPLSKGFQVAFLTPMLNAVRPNSFCLVNSKTARTLRALTGLEVKAALRKYGEVNEITQTIVATLGDELPQAGPEVLPVDVFDAFCHWWVSIYKGARTPVTIVDGEDEEDAVDPATLFGRFYDDSSIRQQMLALLADTIEASHRLAEGSWEITARRRRVRLNVGSIVALEFAPRTIRIGLVPADVNPELRDRLEQEERWSAEFSTDPPVRLCRFEPAELFVHWEALLASQREYIRVAVETGRNSPYRRFHSPSVVDYLEQALGRALPRPAYSVTDDRRPTRVAGERTPTEKAVHFKAPQVLFNRLEYSVDHLVGSIDMGEIGLPELQRPFVWDRSKVRDLFDSMYRGFPVGFLMLWSNAQLLSARAIGTDQKQTRAPSYLVVDGQQRLTSLYAVFKGATVVDEDFRANTIEIAFRPRDSRFAVSDAATRRDPEYIPNISELWTGVGERRFVNDFLEKLRSFKEITSEDEDAVAENISRLINLRTIQLTALVIRPEIQEESVADIFVRINNQGVKLDQADFILTMLSVFWPEGRKQLEAFAKAARIPPAAGSGPSPFNYIIQPGPDQMLRASIALGFHRGRLKAVYQILRGRDPETGLHSATLRDEQFARLKEAQPAALNLNDWHAYLHVLRTAGFLRRELISSDNTVIITYALYLIAKHQCGVSDPDLSRTIRRWFFAANLTGRYTNSVESTMDEDLGELKAAQTPEEFSAFAERVISTSLTGDFWKIALPAALETSSSSAPELSAFWAAQAALGAPVLFADTRVRDLLDPHLRPPTKALEIHHLFPKAWLKRRGITSSKRINQVANLAFLEWPQNRDLSSLSPSEYVPRLREKFQPSQWQHMHHFHALPDRWETMEYEHFLEARRPLMSVVIRQAFEALSGGSGHAGLSVVDATGDEKAVWPIIEQVEHALRTIIRGKYVSAWGAGAEGKIRAALGEPSMVVIEKNREKHSAAYGLAAGETAETLAYCYLGQLGQVMTSNAAWSLFADAFRDKREIEDLLRAITPVRNDLAHFRRVPPHELDRCRIAATDLLRKLETAR